MVNHLDVFLYMSSSVNRLYKHG